MKTVKIIFILFLLVFNNCDKKILRKELEYKDLKIQWYFYSYMTNNSDDMVSIIDKSDETIITSLPDSKMKDVQIKQDSLIIYMVKTNDSYSKLLKGKFYGMYIKYKLVEPMYEASNK